MDYLTPKQIVSELDKYVIGQEEAKKMVAISLRNRYRRRMVSSEMRDDIMPKNILMIGPTGVGKTEIARRLSKLVNAPFIKVEATKFSETGYVGRDVDSIVRDLVDESVRLVREEKIEKVRLRAHELAIEKIVEILVPDKKKKENVQNPLVMFFNFQNQEEKGEEEQDVSIIPEREKLKEQIKNGALDDMIIEIEIEDNSSSPFEIIAGGNMEEINLNLQDVLGNMFPKRKKKKKVTIKEALRILEQEEASNLIDMDDVYEEAKKRAEEDGIIFIDEIDKIASKGSTNGPDVSREGVQRDILPIVEGSTVNTKYGPVKTDYMLFIAAGAFHVAKVTDLIPELQGRFPIRVELKSLSKEDFIQILLKPKNALTKQYTELLKTDNVELEFTKDGIEAIAEAAYEMNLQNEDIGARRLQTVIEQVIMDVSFEAPSTEINKVVIDSNYVHSKIDKVFSAKDAKKYII